MIQTIQKPYQTTQNLTKPYPKSMALTQLVLKTRKIDCTWLYQIVLVLVTPGTHMKPNCRTLALRISLKADAKRPSRAACSSVSRASQNGALLNILWSSLKHFEAVWNSRSRNSLKQSEADWSQAQYYMAQLRSLTTDGLHFSLLGINLLNLSHRHSRNHTFELFGFIVGKRIFKFRIAVPQQTFSFLGILVVPCEGVTVMRSRCKERGTWLEEKCSEWWVKVGQMHPNATMCNFDEILIESNRFSWDNSGSQVREPTLAVLAVAACRAASNFPLCAAWIKVWRAFDAEHCRTLQNSDAMPASKYVEICRVIESENVWKMEFDLQTSCHRIEALLLNTYSVNLANLSNFNDVPCSSNVRHFGHGEQAAEQCSNVRSNALLVVSGQQLGIASSKDSSSWSHTQKFTEY